MLSEVDTAKSEKVEKQVLELWDRIYQTWMTSETTNGPKVTPTAVTTTWEAFIEDIQTSPEIFNLNGIIEFVKQNLGMLMSLMDSIWGIVKGNISLVIGSFSAFISVLLGGGTAVLNFILNMVRILFIRNVCRFLVPFFQPTVISNINKFKWIKISDRLHFLFHKSGISYHARIGILCANNKINCIADAI